MMSVKCSCILCKEEISSNNINKHYKSRGCITGKPFRGTKGLKYLLICTNCKKTRTTENDKQWVGHVSCCGVKGKGGVKCGTPSPKRGRNKENSEDIRRQVETMRKLIISGEISLGKHMKTPEHRSRASINAKKNNLGGYRPHPNKGVYYNGIWLDSKWEERVAKSLDEHLILWERPKVGFIWNDLGNKYYPDFYLVDYDVYLDPKNPYLQIKDATKILESQIRNNIKVIVLSENELSWDIIHHLINSMSTK